MFRKTCCRLKNKRPLVMSKKCVYLENKLEKKEKKCAAIHAAVYFKHVIIFLKHVIYRQDY